MNTPSQIAKHLRAVHFGGNWTSINFKDTLVGISWQQATTSVHDFNTIATLLFHTHYFVIAVLKVLQGGPLDSKDVYSFDHPPIQSQQDWESMQEIAWVKAEAFAAMIEKLPEEKLWEPFTDEKYGSWYYNLAGIIEHLHYHLGQINLIKKILQERETKK